jgi:hypothetical protein
MVSGSMGLGFLVDSILKGAAFHAEDPTLASWHSFRHGSLWTPRENFDR